MIKHVGPLHTKILDYLELNSDGATDEELQQALSLQGNTLRPRRRELQLMGKVLATGVKRPTASGRQAIVWQLAA
jgi:hypothetical protein